jgi:hypothetical protein
MWGHFVEGIENFINIGGCAVVCDKNIVNVSKVSEDVILY